VINRIIDLLPEDQTKLESLKPSLTSAGVDMSTTEGNSKYLLLFIL
jgi:hypothetical protein